MKKERFIKLTNYEGGDVYLNRDTEIVKEIIDIPKDDKYSARTRITTTKGAYLVKESAKAIYDMLK